MFKIFNVSSPLEQFVFEKYQKDEESNSKLIFLFDGFDEMNEDYQKIIIETMKYLKTKPNVKLIGTSTRPQHQQYLEDELQSVAFTLEPKPFCENKITFLERFCFQVE